MTPEQKAEWEKFRIYMAKRAAVNSKGHKEAKLLLEAMEWHEAEILRLTSEHLKGSLP